MRLHRPVLRIISLIGITTWLIAWGGGGGGPGDPGDPGDTTPPITSASPTGGLFGSIQQVTLTANEAATIHYSMDGINPSVGGGIPLREAAQLLAFSLLAVS